MTPAHLEPLAHESLGLVELRLTDAQESHRHQALGHLWMIGAEERSSPIERRLEQRLRFREISQPLIDAPERAVHRDLHRGLGVEVLRLQHAAIDQ